MIIDYINGGFELASGLFTLNHCRVLIKDKHVAGVSVVSIVFFTTWGFWNMYYYPCLDQTFSFYGGLCIVAANLLYVHLILHYRKLARK